MTLRAKHVLSAVDTKPLIAFVAVRIHLGIEVGNAGFATMPALEKVIICHIPVLLQPRPQPRVTVPREGQRRGIVTIRAFLRLVVTPLVYLQLARGWVGAVARLRQFA